MLSRFLTAGTLIWAALGSAHAGFGDSWRATEQAQARLKQELRDSCKPGGPPAIYPALPSGALSVSSDARSQGAALFAWRTYPSGRHEALEVAPSLRRLELTTGQVQYPNRPFALKLSLPRDYARCFRFITQEGAESFEIRVPEQGETRATRLSRQLLGPAGALSTPLQCEGTYQSWRYRLVPAGAGPKPTGAGAPPAKCPPGVEIDAARLLDAVVLSYPTYLSPQP